MSDTETKPADSKPGTDPLAYLTSQVNDLTRRLLTVEAERDGYKVRAADLEKKAGAAPAEAQAAIDKLTKELRGIKHRSVFDKVAPEKGLRPDAVEAFLKLAGYDPGDLDEADPAKVAELVETSREKFPFLYGEVAAGTGQPPPRPGNGKGGTPPPIGQKFRVSHRQIADGAWMADHQDEFFKAQAEGRVEWDD